MRIQKIFLGVMIAGFFTSCKKDTDPIFVIEPSAGAQMRLNGIAGNEAGSIAGNAVYMNFSENKQTAVLRSSWDLGFYSGADFRVVLNNMAGAGAKVLSKNDLNSVNASDTIGLVLAPSQLNPLPEQLAWFDNTYGDLTKTVIPAVSSIDTENKVIILNRGTSGGIAPRPWMKIRILRNVAGGYTLQYAGIQETGFRIIQVPKDAAYNFKFVSFENGLVQVEPEKTKWDLVWTYSIYEANLGFGNVPYNFSDLIAVNYLANVQVKPMVYSRATAAEATAAATAAFNAFNKDSVMAHPPLSGRWTIGSSWRSTQPATGARTDRFYIIKDASGNYYKVKCLSMGVGTDGGTRGKPEFSYALIN